MPLRRLLTLNFAIFPLAIFCNVLRLTAIVLGAQGYGAKAGDFVHEWFGFVTYAISIAAVMLLAHFIRENPVRNNTTTGSDQQASLIV